MSDNLMAYYDDVRDAVVIRLESGQELAEFSRLEAESFGNEVIAAAHKESTGYEEFFAQENRP